MAAYPGDPRARPADEPCTITATGAIKRERDSITGKAVVCSLNGNSHDAEPYHLSDAITTQLDIPLDEMQVVKHHPEQYLIIFDHRRDAQRVLGRPLLQYRGRSFHFAPWTEQKYYTVSVLKFHVRLRIEGLPIHTWSEQVAAHFVRRHCAIHFVEEQSRRRTRTRTYDLWAWCTNPSAIAKKVWLTVSDPDRELPSTDIPLPLVHIHHDRPVGFKHGLTYKLIIHLDVLEDLSLPHSSPDRRIPFIWHYGVEDSLGRQRERPLGRQGRDEPPPRRDDDDHSRRGTRRHRSQSAWGRVSRCRGMVDDCYSSTQRFRGREAGHTPHRSRDATPPSWRGVGPWDVRRQQAEQQDRALSFPNDQGNQETPSKACLLRHAPDPDLQAYCTDGHFSCSTCHPGRACGRYYLGRTHQGHACGCQRMGPGANAAGAGACRGPGGRRDRTSSAPSS